MRILIADDDAVSRELLTRHLRKWGHFAVAAADGNEAWDVLQSDDCPRLAVLDWMMPGLEGTEVVRKLRELEQATPGRRPVYTILLTAREDTEDLLVGFEAGADDYVRKPFHREELKARVAVGVRMQELQIALQHRVRELEQALERVHTLQGLLPICSYCKKIRDDKNYWTDVETYFEAVSNAEFSHGVCPSCHDTHVEPRLEEARRRKREDAPADATSAAPPARSPRPTP